MSNEQERILGRVLAVEETSAVAGAKPTSTLADTRIDVNGNPDTSTTQDSGTAADSTTIFDINPLTSNL